MKFANFQVVGPIGRGGFGEVLLCKAKKKFNKIDENELVAIKIMSKEKKDVVLAEENALKALINKPFISQMLGSFQDRLDVFFVLKLYENGSLHTVIRQNGIFPLHFAQNVVVDILLGVQYLHKIDILHGDMKPDNVLIDNNYRAHIADFGLSFNFKKNAVKGIWGSCTYQSPEQILNVYKLDERIDYFNVGIIFVEIVAGYHPFNRKEKDDVAKNISSLTYEMPTLASEKAISFIKNTLCDATTRLNVSNALKHPFIDPLVASAFNGFVWPSKIHYNTDCENYYTNRSENQNDSDKENCQVNLQENRRKIQKPRLNSQAVVRLLREKLLKVNGAERARISKRDSGFYVICSCGRPLKAIGQSKLDHTTV